MPEHPDQRNKTVSVFGSDASERLAPATEADPRATEAFAPPTTHRGHATPGGPPGGTLGGAEFPTTMEPGAILLGKYEVIRKLGEGGMGGVWLVRHIGLDELRALKIISEGIAGDPQIRARFEREARILAKLRHPNAVAVHDTGIVGQSAYIEMEYVEGENLRSLLTRGGPTKPSLILWLARGICDILSAAHHRGIVHRDLKPENIMVETDPETGRRGVKVLDFGIAKVIGGDGGGGGVSSVTMNTRGILGTPSYSSPEQITGPSEDGSRPSIDHRGDLYSLGVMLYEMLTGDQPFKGEWTQVLYQHVTAAPKPPSEIAPHANIPPAVERLVLKCLEKNPADRPNSAAELYNELRDGFADAGMEGTWLEDGGEATPGLHLPHLTPRASPTEPNAAIRSKPPAARRGVRWGTVGAALVLAAALPAAAVLLWRPSPRVEPAEPPPPDPPAGVSPEVVGFLARQYPDRVYEPDPLAGIIELDEVHWPTAIVQLGDRNRTLRLHDRIYLPEGANPDTSEGTEGPQRLPRAVIVDNGNEPITFRLIQGGDFERGEADKEIGGDAWPSHKVGLSTYYIQERETTIAQFEDYCRRIGKRPGGELRDYEMAKREIDAPDDEIPRHPAVALPRSVCEGFAHALGGELPSEAQWEFAARSRGLRSRFVWTDDASPRDNANIANFEVLGPLPVGSFPKDRTAEGVHDMAGNVREWCRDVWRPYLDKAMLRDPVERPIAGESNPRYAIRGGSFDTPTEMAGTTYRSNNQSFEYRAKNDETLPDVGFRMVLEVVIAEPPSAGGPSPSPAAPPKEPNP